MGTAESKHLSDLPQPNGEYFIMYCCQMLTGKIYLINASDQVARVINDTISKEWSNKSTIESNYPFIKKIDPGSSPFYTFTAESSCKTRHLFCQIHGCLLRYDWVLLSAPQIVHRNGLSAWIYTKSELMSRDLIGDCCAISISSSSDLQFIDFPHHGLVQELASHINDVYRELPDDDNSQSSNELLADGKNSKVGKLKEIITSQYTLSLSGSPWQATGKNSLKGRNLLIDMITFMHSRGFKLQASTLLKEEGSDCLFFAKSSSPPVCISNSYVLLALKANDYLVVLGANDEFVARLRTSFQNHWPEGLKDFKEKHGYPVIALNGNPWPAKSLKEIEVKKMLAHVLGDASEMGYAPIESIDCCRRILEKSSILLSKTAPGRLHFICLSVSIHSDKFYIINADIEERDIIRNEIRKYYIPGLEKDEECGDAWRIKFNCNPLSGDDTKGTLCFQAAMLSIIHHMGLLGYKLMFSADVSKHWIYREDTQ